MTIFGWSKPSGRLKEMAPKYWRKHIIDSTKFPISIFPEKLIFKIVHMQKCKYSEHSMRKFGFDS